MYKRQQHRINESAVLTLVSDTLRAIAEYSRNDRTEFIHTVQETQVAQQSADISKKRRRLAAAQKRAGELEKLICKIYEEDVYKRQHNDCDNFPVSQNAAALSLEIRDHRAGGLRGICVPE